MDSPNINVRCPNANVNILKHKKIKSSNTALILKSVISGLVEKKGRDIVVLDLRKTKSSVTDYFVICTGDSDRHLVSLFESVESAVLTETGQKTFSVEGLQNKEWILLDYFDILVHLFQSKKRDYYGLEELWGDAKIKYIENGNGK